MTQNPKFEARNSKQIFRPECDHPLGENSKPQKSKTYDLEGRTKEFAKNIRFFVKQLPKNTSNFEDIKQLVRSSGSVAANYIEANEALSKKDFQHRIKISRKEAKESILWLELIDLGDQDEILKKQQKLIDEATQLMKIFSAIMRKTI